MMIKFKEILLTRLLFRIKLLLIMLLILSFLLILGFLPFKLHIKHLHDTSYNCNKIEAIAVVTGGAGRIEKGFSMLKNGCGKTMLISGINQYLIYSDFKNSLQKKFEVSNEIMERVFLGYGAYDTESNVSEIVLFATLRNVKNILLITNNYHIPRTMTILKNSMPDHNIDYISLPSEKNLHTEFLEYIKFIYICLKYKKLSLEKQWQSFIKTSFLLFKK